MDAFLSLKIFLVRVSLKQSLKLSQHVPKKCHTTNRNRRDEFIQNTTTIITLLHLSEMHKTLTQTVCIWQQYTMIRSGYRQVEGSTYGNPTAISLDDALQSVKLGWFHYRLLLITGMAYMADSIEVFICDVCFMPP